MQPSEKTVNLYAPIKTLLYPKRVTNRLQMVTNLNRGAFKVKVFNLWNFLKGCGSMDVFFNNSEDSLIQVEQEVRNQNFLNF